MSKDTSERRPWRFVLFRKLSKQIKTGNLEKIKYYADKYEIDLNSFENENRRSLLHVAAKYNQATITLYLLEQGCSMYHQDAKNMCPLYIAAWKRSQDVLEIERTRRQIFFKE